MSEWRGVKRSSECEDKNRGCELDSDHDKTAYFYTLFHLRLFPSLCNQFLCLSVSIISRDVWLAYVLHRLSTSVSFLILTSITLVVVARFLMSSVVVLTCALFQLWSRRKESNAKTHLKRVKISHCFDQSCLRSQMAV